MAEKGLSAFARAIGSPNGVDPIPPEQYLTFLNPEDPPLQQLLAWVRSKTIRLGHRSPFCVDKEARTLTLKDLAQDRGWNISNTHKYWREAEIKGLVRKDGEQLYLCGQVIPEQSSLPLPPPKDIPKLTGMQARLNAPQFAAFRKWPAEKRAQFEVQMGKVDAYAKQIQAEAMAAARSAAEELTDKFFEAHGLPTKRIAKRARPAAVVRLEIRSIPASLSDFVHSPELRFQECTNPEIVQCTKSVSLLTSEEIHREEKSSSSPNPPLNIENGRRRTFPLATAQMQYRFPSASASTAYRCAEACSAYMQSEGMAAGGLSDNLLANAVAVSNRESKNLKGPGGYMTDIPPIVARMLRAETEIPRVSDAERLAESTRRLKMQLELCRDPEERAQIEAILAEPIPPQSEMSNERKAARR